MSLHKPYCLQNSSGLISVILVKRSVALESINSTHCREKSAQQIYYTEFPKKIVTEAIFVGAMYHLSTTKKQKSTM